MKILPRGQLGWRFDREDHGALQARGTDSQLLLKQLADKYPPFNATADPLGVFDILDQGQQGSCFPAGTKVTMHDGTLRNIEDVRFGDGVLTHKGRSRQVIDTMSRSYTGDMYTFFVKGWGKIRMTADHVVRVYRNDQLEWSRADDVLESDQFVVSRGVESRDVRFIDLADFVSDLQFDGDLIASKYSPDWTPRFMPLDSLTCFVLGLFVAEGSTDRTCAGLINRATFTMHEDESLEHNAIIAWAERAGAKASIQKRNKSKAVNVRVQSCILGRFLELVCGKFCNRKHVPPFILCGTEEQKLEFLRGYFAGDGSRARYDAGRLAANGAKVQSLQLHSATASRVLGQQVATLAVSIGMKPGRSLTQKRGHQRFSSYQTYLYSRDAVNFVGDDVGKRLRTGTRGQRIHESDEGQLRPIRSIEVARVENETVYDFTVAEDHSFIAQGLVVHNCQGHSLAACFSICYFLATGRKAAFSRACGYYKAQEKDGIRGDSGSTLSGGQWVATQHGMCLESEWPYPSRYNPREPAGVNYRFKLASSTPMKSAGEIIKWLAAGLPVQTGIMWGGSMDREVVTDFRAGGGGHSTCLWQLRENGNVVNLNSWGRGWNGDGVHEFTPGALEQMVRGRYSEFIGYAPDGFTYPIEEPIV